MFHFQTSDVIDEDNLNPNVGHEYSDYFTNLAPDTVYNVTIGASNNDGGPAFAVRSVHFKTKRKSYRFLNACFFKKKKQTYLYYGMLLSVGL